jgi:hypothetical protein
MGAVRERIGKEDEKNWLGRRQKEDIAGRKVQMIDDWICSEKARWIEN